MGLSIMDYKLTNQYEIQNLESAIDILDIIKIAKKAGDAIMKIYKKKFTIEYKDDKSPLTEADKKSHKIITEGLGSLALGDRNNKSPAPSIRHPIPLLSEEGKQIPYEVRKNWKYYWCIDPIDGTKEFIKKNGEFTVNIALIHKNEPVLGVVYAPAIHTLYYAKKAEGAFKVIADDEFWMLNRKEKFKRAEKLPIIQDLKPSTRNPKPNAYVVVVSRSHLNDETKKFIETLKTNDYRLSTNDYNFISIGSSLKLCLVAEGKADIYPRLAPTMEWDTAAADAIVREAGKSVYQLTTIDYQPSTNDQRPSTNDHRPLQYNKQNLLNPWFVVSIGNGSNK